MGEQNMLYVTFFCLVVGGNKVKHMGSLSTSSARSESRAGSLALKLVRALPCRWYSLVSICIARMLWLQPCRAAFCVYQSRSTGSLTLSNSSVLCDQVICADTVCTNCSSGYISANARMYLRFREEKPRIWGNSACKSWDSLSITLAPHPSHSWRSRILRPICQ